MTQLRRWLVWLSRIHHCRGFGIQSPADYAFADDITIFALSYGKELFQILHLAVGDAPKPWPVDIGPNKGAMEAEFRE